MNIELPNESSMHLLKESEASKDQLVEEEKTFLASIPTKKGQKRFITGRVAARHALEKLKVESNNPLLKGEGGEPLWPDGIVGSISHSTITQSKGFAVALTAKAPPFTVAGIDIENLSRNLTQPIERKICSPSELEWVNGTGFSGRKTRILTLFSAKETIYKALYPIVKRYISFREVELSWHAELNFFKVQYTGELSGSDLEIPKVRVHSQQQGELTITYAISQ